MEISNAARGGLAAVGACLSVALYVYEAGSLQVFAQETLRVDRLEHSQEHGFIAETHGDLVRPGAATLNLQPGVYHMRSSSDLTLQLDSSSAMQVQEQTTDKDEWPDPPVAPKIWPSSTAEEWQSHSSAFTTKGSTVPGARPKLTVVTASVA
ncbi:hypothetical protein [Streptomyces bobili]|uniref:hypothetical protein n=1 Tax=Streptomyces bobili TaxID=67280 RepID=UPI0038305AEB